MNTPKCTVSKKCGGCQYLDLTYEEQLQKKQGYIISLLGKYCHVDDIIGMNYPYHYRNKVCAAFALDSSRHIVSGIYQTGSHAVVPVSECLIEDKKADRIIVDIRKMLPEFKIKVFDERSGIGWLRHVLVKRGFSTNEVMVVLVAVSPIFPLQKHFVAKLLELHPEIKTIVLNINNRFGPVVLGSTEKVIYGEGYIEDILCGNRFRISPKSFYQINPVQCEKLYATAINFADLKGNETIIDAYCGIGTIGITASSSVKQVIGIELNKDAVQDAIVNAKINKIKNCWFTQGDAGEYMTKMALQGHKADVVFMDPPRNGSDEKFMSSVVRIAPSKIVYISCGPDTLARDLDYFTTHGYKVKRIQAVDMFPFTKHCETVCLLSRKA